MNLADCGRRSINLDLIAYIDKGAPPQPEDAPVEIVYAIGGPLRLEGEEAATLRRFLIERSRTSVGPVGGIEAGLDREGQLLSGAGLGEAE